mgnify:CR=1 FL=1
MKKFLIISLILFLVLLTAFVKNSTKTIEDKTFVLEENIRILKKDYENVKLEFDYLSSAEKLLEFQVLYFDDEFIKKDIQNIQIINKINDELEIKKFEFINEK